MQVSGINPFNPTTHPFVYSGHQYALDVVSGKIPNCRFIQGACKRYLKDIDKKEYPFDADRAEKYLRVVQKFSHISGHWKSKNITFEPWQNFLFMNIMGFVNPKTGFRRFRVAHTEVPRGQGKAISLDTDVPTPDRGIIKFGELKIGDRLYDRNGGICKIVGRNEIHYPKLYKMTFSDGTTIKCSSNHLWFTSNKKERDRERDGIKKEYESVKTSEEIFNTQKYGIESNHFVKNSAAVKGNGSIKHPYFIGYWIGNGSINFGKLSCNEKDAEHVRHRLISQGQDVSDIRPVKNKRASVITCYMATGIIDGLKDANGYKRIPECVYRAKISHRMEVLRGLMDSDGTCHIKTGQSTYSTIHENLAKQVNRLVCSLGIKSTIQKEFIGGRGVRTNSQYCYRVSFTTTIKVFSLERKINRLPVSTRKTQNGRYITSVTEIADRVPMFCIEVNSKDNSFLLTDKYIPTHNSLMASQALLYFLSLDNPKGNEISCFATKSDQARIVLDSARAMAKENRSFLKNTGTKVLAHKILHEKSNSVARAMSSEDKGLDGLKDILSIIDELHSVTSELFDVVSSGMSKRSDSLLLCISTAGFDLESVGYSQSTYAKKVATGEVEDDQFFAAVYTIDEGDDIYAEATWKKANPGYGISVDPTTFAAKAKKTLDAPRDLPNFKVKHLNTWLSEANAYYDQAKWDLCADSTLRLEDFKGQKCKMGVDLASKVDLCSLGYIFYKEGIYYMFDRSYIPEDRVKLLRNSMYDNSIGTGHLLTMPGDVIDQEKIQNQILEDKRMFKVDEILLDGWNAAGLMQKLSREKMNVSEFRMVTSNLSEPTKQLDALMRQGKIRHNGSPVLRWTLGNVVCKEDAAANVFPRKTHEKLKIDPIISLLMALAPWLQDKTKDSIYNTRELRSF